MPPTPRTVAGSAPSRPPSRRDTGPVARTQWYVTAHTVRPHIHDGQLLELPISQAHAKRLGTMITACGLWTDSWRKLYDLPFPLPQPWANRLEPCPDCQSVVAHHAAFEL